MPSNIVETATKGSAISAPLDADLRNAASVRTPLQSVGNRLAWLEAVVSRLFGTSATANAAGTSLVPEDNLTLDLSSGRLDIVGNDDNNINLGGVGGTPGGVQLFANGNMAAHMFTAGRTGRANKKLVNLGTSANQTIDPRAYDTFAYLTGAAIDVQVSTAEVDLEDGDWFRVINKVTSAGAITVKNTAGVTLHVVPLPSGGLPAMREYTWHAATSSWVLTDWTIA